jgi:hypothetical protein
MFSLKLFPFLSPEKPGSVKKGFEKNSTVLRRQIVEDTPEKMLGRMFGILEKAAYTGNAGKHLFI